MAALQRLAQVLNDAQAGIAFTGAGVSTASGIPDFRSEGGVWEQHDQADFYYDRFQRDPGGFWADRVALHETRYGAIDPAPNAAHHALARLTAEGYLEAIVTQNVDGLHADAAEATLLAAPPPMTRTSNSCMTRIYYVALFARRRRPGPPVPPFRSGFTRPKPRPD